MEQLEALRSVGSPMQAAVGEEQACEDEEAAAAACQLQLLVSELSQWRMYWQLDQRVTALGEQLQLAGVGGLGGAGQGGAHQRASSSSSRGGVQQQQQLRQEELIHAAQELLRNLVDDLVCVRTCLCVSLCMCVTACARVCMRARAHVPVCVCVGWCVVRC